MGPGAAVEGRPERARVGREQNPVTYCALPDVFVDTSVELAAVTYVDSPWYWPRKLRIMGRPVASRASLMPPSTASVPVTVAAARVMRDGASSTSRSASAMTGSDWRYIAISMP